MVLLNDSVEFKKLDVRLVERNLARGALTAAELNQAVSQLPDDSENAEWVNIETLMEDPEVEMNNCKSSTPR